METLFISAKNYLDDSEKKNHNAPNEFGEKYDRAYKAR